jgi:hypothetical protein
MTVEITITTGMRIKISVVITIRIIGGRITTGTIYIRIMGTMRITIGLKNNKYNNTNNNIKKNNDLWARCCWKTGQTDTWTDP